MGIEEKAKAYDEALEKAKVHINNKGIGDTVDLCKHLFPELRESEDERIRKSLWKYFHGFKPVCDNDFLSSFTIDDILAWLEKQKEQKPEIKYVYPKFRKGDVIEPITPNGHCEPVRVVGIWDGSYSCRSDDGKAYLSLPIKHEDEYRLVEQKPAEWSEEDEEVREALYKHFSMLYPGDSQFRDTKRSNRQITAWLKSLRSSWKPSERQMKALEVAFRKDGDDEYRNIINSLYNDLKKL